MRLKPHELHRQHHRYHCGNWGGFSFEIETFLKSAKITPISWRGNWGGFSFEIETT